MRPERPRDLVLPAHISSAPEIPTLHVLVAALDAAQAAIRDIWGQDDRGEIRQPPPYEQEAELARAVLDHIQQLAASVCCYRDAMLWRVPNDEFETDPEDRCVNPATQDLNELDDQLF